jgi:hypothetical protein
MFVPEDDSGDLVGFLADDDDDDLAFLHGKADAGKMPAILEAGGTLTLLGSMEIMRGGGVIGGDPG